MDNAKRDACLRRHDEVWICHSCHFSVIPA
jgi:hypothetical protein